MRQFVYRYCFVLLTIIFLVSCDGGGDNNKIPGKPFPDYKINGTAFIGQVQNAEVDLYTYTNGVRGNSIASTSTDLQGRFTVTTNAQAKSLLICITGGEYTESFSGSVIPLSETDELCSVFKNTAGQDSKILINYFSHLAYGLSKYWFFSKSQTPIETANTTISEWLGFDIIRTEQRDVTEISNNVILTESLRVGYANAAVSLLADQLSKLNGRPQGKEYTTIVIAKTAHNDIAYDGILDGQGAKGTIMIGGISMEAKYYRHDIAFNTLVFANSPQNRALIISSQLVDSATLINDSKSSIFGDDPILSFITDIPVIHSATIKATDVISGAKKINIGIDDLVGLSEITFSIGNNNPLLFGGIGKTNFKININFKNPGATLNTVALNDGIGYFITINAKNVLGNAAVEFRINDIAISNNGATISSISPIHSPNNPALIRGIIYLEAIIKDPIGIQSVMLSIDGGELIPPDIADLANPRFIVDTTLIKPDGFHTFVLTATNKGGIITTRVIRYQIDNTPPLLGFVEYPAINKNVFWNIGSYVVTGYSSDINGLKSTKMSLTDNNEILFTGNLTNNKISAEYVISNTSIQGKKTLLIQSIDNAGGIANSTRTVYVDYTKPTITIQNVSVIKPPSMKKAGINGNWVAGAKDAQGQSISLLYSGIISDPYSGIRQYRTGILANKIITTVNQPTPPNITNGVPKIVNFSKSIIPSEYQEGFAPFTVLAEDNAGNSNSAIGNELYFDNTNPSITISPQNVTYRPPASCSLNITTTDSGGSGIARIILDGVDYPIKSGTWSFTMPTGPQNVVKYIVPFYYEIIDTAGNSVKRKIRYNTVCNSNNTSCRCQFDYPTGVGQDWFNPI